MSEYAKIKHLNLPDLEDLAGSRCLIIVLLQSENIDRCGGRSRITQGQTTLELSEDE